MAPVVGACPGYETLRPMDRKGDVLRALRILSVDGMDEITNIPLHVWDEMPSAFFSGLVPVSPYSRTTSTCSSYRSVMDSYPFIFDISPSDTRRLRDVLRSLLYNGTSAHAFPTALPSYVGVRRSGVMESSLSLIELECMGLAALRTRRSEVRVGGTVFSIRKSIGRFLCCSPLARMDTVMIAFLSY